MMYYVTVMIAALTTVLGARFCVGAVARIHQRWLRRVIFWLVVLPVALFVSGCLFGPVSDDIYMRCSPSHVAAIALPLLALISSLIGFGLVGFRSDKDSDVPRAKHWKTGRTGLQLVLIWPLLILSLFLFDQELQHRLRKLKAEAQDNWEAIERPSVADDENGATDYLMLANWQQTIDAWQQEHSETALVDVNFDDERLARMSEECAPAFELIRAGSRMPRFQLQRHRIPDADGQQETLAQLENVLQLFQINLLAQAHRGDVAEAYADTQALLRLAKQLDSDECMSGRVTAMLARHYAMDALQHLLQFDPHAEAALLSALVDEQYNPRKSLGILFAWAEADHVISMCMYYLGEPSGGEQHVQLEDHSPASSQEVYLARMLVRVSRARDDLIAARECSSVYTSFARRYLDPTATSDALAERLGNRIPQGTLARFDPRDLLYHWTLTSSTDQQLINATVALTLYHRRHGKFPSTLGELVPDFLSAVPVCSADGSPLRMRPIGAGLLIYGSNDDFDIDREFKKHGTVTRSTAIKYLNSSVFLGEAFDLVLASPHP